MSPTPAASRDAVRSRITRPSPGHRGLHSGPCSLIRFYASMHLGAAVQNFYKVENALGAFRGHKEKMARGPEPTVRDGGFPVPEGPGLGLDLNEDWLRSHVASGETWWG